MALEAFEEAKASAQLEDGGVLNVHSTRRIACDSTVMRAVLGGQVRDPGHRAVGEDDPERDSAGVDPAGQGMRVSGVWDEAPAMPRLSRDPLGRRRDTCLDNLVLLCSHHHRVVHHGNWQVAITAGRPEFAYERAAGQRFEAGNSPAGRAMEGIPAGVATALGLQRAKTAKS
jgi:hypothetical protein